MGLISSLTTNPPLPTDPEVRAETMRRLNVIAVIAIADALLLAVLLWASFSDRESAVHVLGPIHGLGFVALLYLCVTGAVEQRWGWWYPLSVLVTGGPLGSLIGDWILRRRIAAG
jgi:hypothetical protein